MESPSLPAGVSTLIRLPFPRLLMTTLCCLCLAWNSVDAAELLILKPFDAVSIDSPVQPVPPGGPHAYAASGPAASWSVVAWDIPGGELQPFKTTRQHQAVVSVSQAAEASVSVVHEPANGAVIWLSQDGRVLPCLLANGEPRESDLLLSPNQSSNPFGTSGYIVPSHAFPLTSLRHLIAIATISYQTSPSPKSEACGVVQASVIMALVLNDQLRQQTIFYQLELTEICGPQPVQRQVFCQMMQSVPRAYFFARSNPFGINDQLPLLGQPFLTPGETRAVHVDLSPRVMGILRDGPLSMDRDVGHWVLGGFYVGQNIWGGLRLSTRWSRVQLAVDTADQTGGLSGR